MFCAAIRTEDDSLVGLIDRNTKKVKTLKYPNNQKMAT